MIRFKYILFLLLLFFPFASHSQTSNAQLEQSLKDYISTFSLPGFRPNMLKMALSRYELDTAKKTIFIYGNEGFSSQSFTPEIVQKIYNDIHALLPEAYKNYDIKVFAFNKEISTFIPNIYRTTPDKERLWGKLDYQGHPWTANISLPLTFPKGLENRHMIVWPSHGYYFSHKRDRWEWQRPHLFCTTEDLFTQSIVVPFLIPMLQNSGAVVFTPRERDWQPQEVIVDNDPISNGKYLEENGKEPWKRSNENGFARIKDTYLSNQNPFMDGTARIAKTVKVANKASFCQWIPEIPEDGHYAVYVTYQSLPGSVSDAIYTIFHRGVTTKVRVNQQMGAGTWVYLGSYDFAKGETPENSITLTNQSKEAGIISADAVRLGGGMGNIARGVEEETEQVSGKPRFLEGARYAMQWYGMPDSIYDTKDGRNDYADDINSRTKTMNYLGGGSIYIPDSIGQRVPFELSLAIHSDAGATRDGNVIGTLAINTYKNGNGDSIFHSGLSRMASSDLAGILQQTLCEDLSHQLGISWTRREHFNRNYGETRVPEVPSAIVEMLSHQNFEDMKFGHDPNFKFLIARNIYKGILKFIACQHQQPFVMQPLPISHFSALLQSDSTVLLSWKPSTDELNPTAQPEGYLVYTRSEGEDFDNGIIVREGTSLRLEIQADKVYSFKVCAFNAGGISFPSEILSVMKSSVEKGEILIVNGFDRLSGPAIVQTPDALGFDLNKDIGVAYMKTPEYSGAQQNFDITGVGREGENGLGFCGSELEGTLITGNTFDYPVIHGQAIAANKKYSFSSISRDALVNESPSLNRYKALDLILGLQRDCGQSSIYSYKTFPISLQKLLTQYAQSGGSLLVTGSYIASDMTTAAERQFLTSVLHYDNAETTESAIDSLIQGSQIKFTYNQLLGKPQYAVAHPDRLLAVGNAFSCFNYSDGTCAGICYSNPTSTILAIGIPFESISSTEERNNLMDAFLGMLPQ